MAATIAQPHCKKPINPLKIIPPQYRPKLGAGLVKKSKKVVEAESPRAWKALDRFFAQGGKKPETYVLRVEKKGK